MNANEMGITVSYRGPMDKAEAVYQIYYKSSKEARFIYSITHMAPLYWDCLAIWKIKHLNK